MSVTVCSRVEAQFSEHFGEAPEGVWSAPGRVNLVGEHTDYNAGLCLPVPLAQRTFAAARPRADGRVLAISMDVPGVVDIDLPDVGPQRPGGWGAYVAGTLWALRQAGHRVGGMELLIGSELLIGAGLSSSAALECSVAAAASDVFGLGLLADDAGRAELARLCQRAENEVALAPTGGVDQTSALRSRPGMALLLDFRERTLTPVPYRPEDAGVAVVIVDTGTRHDLARGQFGGRRAEMQRIAALLDVPNLRAVEPDGLTAAMARLGDPVLARRLRHVVTENARVVAMAADLASGDWERVGQGMTAAHYSMRDDLEVSCPQVDLAVEAMLTHGALGARLVGGGFGGCAIGVVPFEAYESVRTALGRAFADAGYNRPTAFLARAGGPAGRDS